MLKIVEGALKKENDSVLLECLKKWIKRIRVLSLKQKPTRGIKKDKGICHHCGKEGHWMRNCKEYLATVKAKKLNEAST
jgi:hypothetical protein